MVHSFKMLKCMRKGDCTVHRNKRTLIPKKKLLNINIKHHIKKTVKKLKLHT